ncbi:MAG: 4Fe-4S dicluster domain-containing protein [Candidatus Saliniplasma sp.]
MSKEKEENSDIVCWDVETKKKKGGVCLIPERCKGCGFCIEFCPVGALKTSEDTTEKGYHPPEMTEGCILCGKCEKICPEFSIYLKEEDE